jgi:hydrogen peroxide-dependent heme synthase
MNAPETLDGWFALHDLRLLDRPAWNRLSATDRGKAAAEAASLLASFEKVDDAPEGMSVTYGVIGHRADVLVLHFRPDLDMLYDLERALDRTLLGSVTTRPYSYLSVVELSRQGAPEGTAANIEQSPAVQARLRPQLPAHHSHVCFYPMSKKRAGADNWYTLSDSERQELMRAHGQTGRRYAGKLTQIITGSMGLDDWEWGVTLFADDPLQFKRLIYEMRFDEVSARYAEFGPFVVGLRLPPDQLEGYLDG